MTNPLSEKAMLASLSITRWQARKFDKKTTKEVLDLHKAQDEVGRWNKKLVSTAALSEVTSVITAAREAHYRMTQPWLDDGARILPSALFYEYQQQMQKFADQYDRAADKFAKGYPDYVEAAKKAMNGMFNAADYPHPSRIRKAFSFESVLLPLPASDDFRVALNKNDVAKIRAQVEAQLDVAVANSKRDMAERIAEHVGHMAERLKAYKPAVPGKNKKETEEKAQGIFRDSLVENVRDLAKLLGAFNLTNDPKLTAIIKQIEDRLCTVDADTLRESDTIRAGVAEQADKVLEAVSEFLA